MVTYLSVCAPYHLLDVSLTAQPAYLQQHLVARDPFEQLDEEGAGSMLLSAVKRVQRAGTPVRVS